MEDIEIIHSEAIYGAKTNKPLVKISWGEKSIVVTTRNAKELAYDIMDCAHAADGDAFMVHWLRDRLKVDDEKLWKIIAEFRDERVRMNGEN